MRAPPAPTCYTLLTILFSHRHEEVIDFLADLLDGISFKFGNMAKNTTRKVPLKNRKKDIMKYYIILIVSGVFFIYNLIASGIVGSYIIDAENYKKHLIFTDPPFDKSNISDIDKLLYAGKISSHPYFAIISLIFIIIIIVMMIKTNGEKKYSNSNS